MNRSGFSKPTAEEARDKAREWQAKLRARQESKPRPEPVLRQARAIKCKPMTAPRADPEGWPFRKAVRDRDGNTCQFPGCGVQEVNTQEEGSVIDVHHIATRKRRPDLIYVVANGVCLCNVKTYTNHHGWVHLNPLKAVEMGLLSDRTRELAEKEGTLGQY